MKANRNISIITLLFTLLFSSCIHNFWIDGNGDVTEEERTVPEFSSISSAGSFDIYYEYADSPNITVSCESNLQMYIETVVYNDELKIRTPMGVNIRPHQTIEIYVEGPYVDKISLTGSGLIHTEEIKTDTLILKTSGSGDIETTFYGEYLKTKITGSGDIKAYTECDYYEGILSGSGDANFDGNANNALYKVAGSGNFEGYNFSVNNFEIHIGGSGNMYVNVIDNLDINISGSGNIYYIGTPEITSTNNGSGNVYNKN